MRVAVVGCAHGELDAMYAALEEAAARGVARVDAVLCCGDFEASRNAADLETMACPPKYRLLNDFWRYYAGAATAPVLTVFVGGNHEASSHMQELPYGGWVAPNIYYVGHAGCVRLGGLRVAGVSGIHNGRDAELGRFERVPYSPDTLRSVFHTRRFDTERVAALSGAVDVMLSHDWPLNAGASGDAAWLARRKPHFRDEMARGELGSPALRDLMLRVRPRYWFSAHMHVKYAGIVRHDGGAPPPPPPDVGAPPVADANEIDLDAGEGGAVAERAAEPSAGRVPDSRGAETRFLALDKVVPSRDFMQIVELPGGTGDATLRYDVEWLAVVRATHAATPLARSRDASWESSLARDAIADAATWIRANVGDEARDPDAFVVPRNFAATVEPARGSKEARARQPDAPAGNPQTDAFLKMLGLEHRGTVPFAPRRP